MGRESIPIDTSKAARERREELLRQSLGVGGGVYASSHTASAYPWWVVVLEGRFPSKVNYLVTHVYRVQAQDAALARIAAEREYRNMRDLKVTSVAREEWRRL